MVPHLITLSTADRLKTGVSNTFRDHWRKEARSCNEKWWILRSLCKYALARDHNHRVWPRELQCYCSSLTWTSHKLSTCYSWECSCTWPSARHQGKLKFPSKKLRICNAHPKLNSCDCSRLRLCVTLGYQQISSHCTKIKNNAANHLQIWT